MKIRILLFAAARDIFGNDFVDLELPDNVTIKEVKQSLVQHSPASAELVARSAFSINQEFAIDESPVTSDAELALIPPVSGG
ncbi:MAG: MoaD/ThiS family protein [Planctomycetota bacterium]